MADTSYSHLAQLLLYHAQYHANDIAIRHKQLGIWKEWSWHALLGLSERFATALKVYGFHKDQSVLIMSSPNVQVVAISLAVQALGGKIQLIDGLNELNTTQLKHYLNVIQPDYVLVEELEQLQSLQQLSFSPIYIFYIQENLSQHINPENVVSLNHLLSDLKYKDTVKFSELELAQHIFAFSFERIEEQERFRVHYSHQELLNEANQLVKKHQLESTEQAFIARAFSSVGHIRYLWSAWLLAGFTLNIPESLETRDQDRQMIAPTLVLGTKYTYERVYQLIQHRLPQKETWLGRRFQYIVRQKSKSQPLSFSQNILWHLFEQVIGEQFGFSRLRTALIVGEQISEDILYFFHALGIELQQWNHRASWERTSIPDTAQAHLLLPTH